jgi:hypothetical protein
MRKIIAALFAIAGISFGQKIETTERPVVHGTMDSKADFPAATA